MGTGGWHGRVSADTRAEEEREGRRAAHIDEIPTERFQTPDADALSYRSWSSGRSARTRSAEMEKPARHWSQNLFFMCAVPGRKPAEHASRSPLMRPPQQAPPPPPLPLG